MEEMNFKVHSIKYNFIMNTILKMSSFVFPLITFPYVSRVLGAVGNGKVSFAASVVSYFSMFASLGIPTYGIRVCAESRDDKEKLSQVVQELLIICMCCTIIAYLAFVICVLTIPRFKEDMVVLFVSSISLVLTSVGVEWFYQGIEQYDYITIRNIAVKIISIIAMFLFVKKQSDFVIYAFINVIGTVGSNILNILRLKKFITFKKLKKYNLKKHLKPAFVFLCLSATITVYTNLDVIMLGFMKGDAQVGYYNAAIKIRSVLLSIVTALGTVVLPRASYYYKANMKKEFEWINSRSLQFVVLLSLPLAIFFTIESSDVIYLLAGAQYDGAINPLRCILPTIVFVGISTVTGTQILVPMGCEKITAISTAFGAITDLFLNLFLIKSIAASGAAIATTIAELIVLIVQIVYLKGKISLSINIMEYSKIILGCFVSSAIVLMIKSTFNIENVLLNLIVVFVIYFMSYGSILLFLKENLVVSCYEQIRDFCNKVISK